MEAVTLDFVEQTADFMFHLTKKQLDERIEDLKKRQFNIYQIVNTGMMDKDNPSKRDYAYRMAFIIIRVMESYEIKIPMISINTIKEVIKIKTKVDKVADKGFTDEELMQKSLDELGQEHYFIYLKKMVSTDLEYQAIFTHEESHVLFYIMSTIAMVYQSVNESYS